MINLDPKSGGDKEKKKGPKKGPPHPISERLKMFAEKVDLYKLWVNCKQYPVVKRTASLSGPEPILLRFLFIPLHFRGTASILLLD
jgi:hypothetical protein